MKNITFNVTLPSQRIVDLFITACEGGSNYWCKELTPVGRSKDSYQAMLSGFTVIEFEGEKKRRVTVAAINNALRLFPVVCPQAFADLVAEQEDAETADQFLQLCVFGEVIYG